MNENNRATVEGEPAQAVPAFTKDCPCECGAYGGPGSHAHWCKYASPPAGTAAVSDAMVERALQTFQEGYCTATTTMREAIRDALRAALLAQGNQEGNQP